MAEFESAVEALLKKEAGFVDDKDDHGGATNFGISSKRFPEIDVTKLTREQAITLYRVNYWHPLYDKIEEQAIANKLLELTVNMAHDATKPFYGGRMRGVELVQRACRALGDREVSTDGLFGPQTLQSIRLERPEALLAAIRVEQARAYLAIADKDESQRKFLRGWMRRALVALTLAAALPSQSIAQQDTLERMEEDFLKMSEPCNALKAEEQTVSSTDYRVRIYRCGHRLWRLWQYRCPEGYWSRVFLLDQADEREDSYYLDRFAGLHNGKPGLLVEAYRPRCAS